MEYIDIVNYKNNEEIRKHNLIWDYRIYFTPGEANKIINDSNLHSGVLIYNGEIIILYNMDRFDFYKGRVLAKGVNYILPCCWKDHNQITFNYYNAVLVWYNKAVHLCVTYTP